MQRGANYGWPFCFGDRQPDVYLPAVPKGLSKAAYCAQRTVAPTLTYTPHSAPLQLAFSTAPAFGKAYRGDAFVAMHGSWNRETPVGYKVVRVHFDQGQPTAITDFLDGFLVDGGAAQFGRPAGVAVAGDGALLVSDDTNGTVYRVARR